MKSKKGLIITIISTCFLSLMIFFIANEVGRYSEVRDEIQEIGNSEKITSFAFFNMIEAGKTTFLDMKSIGQSYAQKKAETEIGYVLQGGQVLDYVDYWMASMISRRATPKELSGMYVGYFLTMLNFENSAKYTFYLFRILAIFLASLLPGVGALITTSFSVASVKYAFATAVIIFFFVSVKKASAQTFIEIDILTDGNKPVYETMISNFTKEMTSVIYVTENTIIGAAGPNFKLFNGTMSPLAGIHTGKGDHGIAIKEISIWYFFYSKLFRSDYVTFGLYDKSVDSRNWWVWFKHELVWPLSKTYGLGARIDGTLLPGKKKMTFGPTFRIKWDKMTSWIHYRLGGEIKYLFLRMEVAL